jgi:maltokinase
MSYRDGRGLTHAVGVLEGWIDNRGDGWRYVTTHLARDGGRDDLLEALRHLGAITADLHIVLASDAATPAFAPEAVGLDDLTIWSNHVLREAARVLDLVSHNSIGWVEPAYGLSGAALAGREQLRRLIRSLKIDEVGARTSKIRVHGDYHLGQTLKTSGGFVLIDFEGEPARPLADRRRKYCALKDVAGMLRSLDYADAAVRLETPSAASVVSPMRGAFLDGYYSRPELRAILPERESSRPLLTMFELEKVLYEIEYELNNRPDWLPIPLGALARVVAVSP